MFILLRFRDQFLGGLSFVSSLPDLLIANFWNPGFEVASPKGKREGYSRPATRFDEENHDR